MRRSRLGAGSPSVEAAVGFALGAVGGCILGATEGPVDRVLSLLTAAGPLKPVMEEVRTVGALGLGTLVGATALSAAMTSAVAGVILAALVASVFLVSRSCQPSSFDHAGFWVSVGMAGAIGTTISGATIGVAIQWIVNMYGMVGLLWALSVFTVLKPLFNLVFKSLWGVETCCTLGSTLSRRRPSQISEDQLRQSDAELMEQRILSVETGVETGAELKTKWAVERHQREERERKKREMEEVEIEQKIIQDWINTMVIKHVDFLAFSGIPMTVVAIVASGLGVIGYGDHQLVFIVLLALVTVIAFQLMKSSDFKFWMLVGCMGMIATFVIAILTLHAGQEVVSKAMRMEAAGTAQSRENVSTRMNLKSSVEALNSSMFVARLCQMSLGATVGGALVRRAAGEVKVIVGGAAVAGGLLAGVEVLGPVLGEGGRAGALLGVVGTAGAVVGGAASVAGCWSSWSGTLGTVFGLLLGALGAGQWHLVNVGLQVPAAYVFAMINPF